MEIINYRVRASYPSYYMVYLYVTKGIDIFKKENDNNRKNPNLHEREGNKPGTVIYTLENGENREIAPLWPDMFYMLNNSTKLGIDFLKLLIEEKETGIESEALGKTRLAFKYRCITYFYNHPIFDDDYVVTPLTRKQFTETEVSHKGRMLLELTEQCYAVPNFSILSSNVFYNETIQTECILKSIRNLEFMCEKELGSDTNPLVFAIRSAMPVYIPGLMPTLLNIGVTHQAYEGLAKQYGNNMANRIYLNNLYNIAEYYGLNSLTGDNDNKLTEEQQFAKIKDIESKIYEQKNGYEIINNAEYQVIEFVKYVWSFYSKNHDLVITFMQGKQAFPSIIFQQMVWTIGSCSSYPGVLYSRHSRTGVGIQIENYPDIFGEEIMTGNVSPENNEYIERIEIKDKFPALYHFDPLLPNLEKRCKSPVTIEFGVENDVEHNANLFAVLQLNKSELTGRAALQSAINMYETNYISSNDVIDLIHPYHLRQIFSDTIDDNSFNDMQFFGSGVSVLPRSAVTAVITFNTTTVNKLKSQNIPVCLCRQRFTPEDTIMLNEVNGILSMTPAAIHVVTACRGYGIPAFLNLQSHGITFNNNELINESGLVIKEGDWITLSSRRQSIYLGKAHFRPARFMSYLNGAKLDIDKSEEVFFSSLRDAYQKYQVIITSNKTNYISNIDTLARLITYDLKEYPDNAKVLANNWYEENKEKYIDQVLNSPMGSHQEQSRVFNLLCIDNKVDFIKKAVWNCQKRNISGMSAGSFMLGRFIAQTMPSGFWKQLSAEVIEFLLNEYILYEKYLLVLEEVGDMRTARAHAQISTEGLPPYQVKVSDFYNFIPLMYTHPDWTEIKRIEQSNSTSNDTFALIDSLSKPIEELFDLSQPWNAERVNKYISTYCN